MGRRQRRASLRRGRDGEGRLGKGRLGWWDTGRRGDVLDPHDPHGWVKEGGKELGPWCAGLPARYEPGGQGVAWLLPHRFGAGDIAVVLLSKEAS